MTHFAALAFAIAVAMGVFIWLCLPGARWRSLATAAFTALTLGAFAAGVESTGQPKPVQLEWRSIDDNEMVGLAWNEPEQRVYIWLMRDGEPHAYVLPWPDDKRKMGQLQERWGRRGVTGEEFRYDAEGEVARVVEPEPMPEKTE